MLVIAPPKTVIPPVETADSSAPIIQLTKGPPTKMEHCSNR